MKPSITRKELILEIRKLKNEEKKKLKKINDELINNFFEWGIKKEEADKLRNILMAKRARFMYGIEILDDLMERINAKGLL